MGNANNHSAVQISWLTLAYPCLLLAYIGQAAYISSNTGAYTNPFFNTLPPGMLWPGIVISILAAVVGSQAIITASFQLVSQIMTLSYFPNVKMSHTSERFYGQIYVPLANWLLMLGSVAVTALYNDVSLTSLKSKTTATNLLCINRPRNWAEPTALALRWLFSSLRVWCQLLP